MTVFAKFAILYRTDIPRFSKREVQSLSKIKLSKLTLVILSKTRQEKRIFLMPQVISGSSGPLGGGGGGED